MTTNVAILLGAGSSIPAGYPSTQKLTDSILSGSDWPTQDDGSDNPNANFVNCLVKMLHNKAQKYQSKYSKQQINYEDLFYLIEQILSSHRGGIENPAIVPFINEIEPFMRNLILSLRQKEAVSNMIDDNTIYNYLFSQAHNYIWHVVNDNLFSVSKKTSHLSIVQDICKKSNVTCIATLCHDIHLETFLTEKCVQFTDGFSGSKGDDIRHWENNFSSIGDMPFLKLHGSVNWYPIYPIDGDQYDKRVSILHPDQYDRTTAEYHWDMILEKDSADQKIPLIQERAELLMGTFNKTLRYGRGIFLEIHSHFRSAINKADKMIICGYSFGDQGINFHIRDWYYGKHGRQFVIIHPQPDDLIANAYPGIQEWLHKNRASSIVFIEKYLEKVNSKEILDTIVK